jgi:hypothetical protein
MTGDEAASEALKGRSLSLCHERGQSRCFNNQRRRKGPASHRIAPPLSTETSLLRQPPSAGPDSAVSASRVSDSHISLVLFGCGPAEGRQSTRASVIV